MSGIVDRVDTVILRVKMNDTLLLGNWRYLNLAENALVRRIHCTNEIRSVELFTINDETEEQNFLVAKTISSRCDGR